MFLNVAMISFIIDFSKFMKVTTERKIMLILLFLFNSAYTISHLFRPQGPVISVSPKGATRSHPGGMTAMCPLSPLASLDLCTRLTSSKKIVFILESKAGCLMVTWANAVFTVIPAIPQQESA